MRRTPMSRFNGIYAIVQVCCYSTCQRMCEMTLVLEILLLSIGAILVLVIAGAIYQSIATQSDKHHYSAPGQLVDVGGYRLHIHCSGQGSPTVILEAAADMMSADWGWIQPELAKKICVCAYDRAGMGWSDPGPQPRDARQVSTELHTLLARAGITGPYVLVGHSAGGLYVRMYTAQYPDEVVGMVLVDPGHPDMTEHIPELRAQNARDWRFVGTMRMLSYLGIPRRMGIGKANAQGLPPEQVAEVNAFISTPQHWATILALIDASPATEDEVRATATLGDRPLVVISAGTAWLSRGAPADDARRRLNELHGELTKLSTNSTHRIIEGATHGSLVHNREDAQTTVAAVEAVLTAIQTDGPVHKRV
jgi:pimeloyl-ACP methyl ester carboxylesterase